MKTFTSLLYLLMFFCSCNRITRTQKSDVIYDQRVKEGQTSEFVLPNIPVTIIEQHDRMAYFAEHYWDSLNIRDSSFFNNRELFEKTFVNYIYYVSLLEKEYSDSCIVTFMRRFVNDSRWMHKILETAEMYLYDVESPIFNEAIYVPFVKTALESSVWNEIERIKYLDQLEVSSKNLPGNKATDFLYLDRTGIKKSLLKTINKLTVLCFTDPECPSCIQTIGFLHKNVMINRLISEGYLDVLLIYTEGNESAWEKMKNNLPDNWILGFDNKEAVRFDRLYELRAMPSVYLLKDDGMIIIKDKPIKVVTDFILDLVISKD